MDAFVTSGTDILHTNSDGLQVDQAGRVRVCVCVLCVREEGSEREIERKRLGE